MKLQNKSFLGLSVIFILLAFIVGMAGYFWVNYNTIQAAEERVSLYMRNSWAIYWNKAEHLQTSAEIMAEKQSIRELLKHPGDSELSQAIGNELKELRERTGIDIITLLDTTARVLINTQYPFRTGFEMKDDPLVRQVLRERRSTSGTVIFDRQLLGQLGPALAERCGLCGDGQNGMVLATVVPVSENGKVIGLLQLGGLLNGSTDKVDRIRDAVFANEIYRDKPLGTATIFMGDRRISTNVAGPDGDRALGTRVSPEVAEKVLRQGESWTGRAWVVDTWYLSRYDPIRNPDGTVIGILYVGELEQKYLDLRQKTLIVLIGIILLVMILALAVFYFINRGILNPLQRLLVATRRLAGGDFSHEIELAANDEIGLLTESFNSMTRQLHDQQTKILEQQQKLEQSNRDLQTTNHNYMEMLGFVSHELKNPLASATMSLHTVKDGYLGVLNPAQEKSLTMVGKSLDYFSDMITNYLDLSRLEKGELRTRIKPVPINKEVLEPVIDGLRRGMEEKGYKFSNLVDDDLTLVTDRDLLKIVFDNLLSNAIKYGREGGRIDFTVERTASGVSLSVYNEGEGIEPEKISQLFQKFSRLDNKAYSGKKGTGLGLYICREIVNKLGGRINVESKVGQWTRFVVTLPVNSEENHNENR
ncbi:MAG: cache domain-containing protein [Candidatus Neomarinimicrobiota bacterium]